MFTQRYYKKNKNIYIVYIDQYGLVCKSIEYTTKLIKEKYGENTKVIFGKWGDRFAENIPEVAVCNDLSIEIKDGLGKKICNSSEYRAK